MLPPGRPEMGRHMAEMLLTSKGVTEPALLARRGYYLDTMGVPGQNDRGIYDDAIMLVTPTSYVTFNANCDPSRYQPRVAVLKAGVWQYKVGIHGLSKPKDKQYTALVQAGEVTVLRDNAEEGKPPVEDTGYFGINIHCGSHNSTSSLGCQTIYPEQWEAFIALVQLEMKRHEMREIKYVLTEHTK